MPSTNTNAYAIFFMRSNLSAAGPAEPPGRPGSWQRAALKRQTTAQPSRLHKRITRRVKRDPKEIPLTGICAGQGRFTLRSSRGQGRGRTADLPLFRRTLVPTELPGLRAHIVRTLRS